jgi:hypothetical protein
LELWGLRLGDDLKADAKCEGKVTHANNIYLKVEEVLIE